MRRGEITANGLTFGFLTAGPPDGPLALCLHGFPDSAYTWRRLLPELAAAGYRAVAPFMRGYAPTEVPADGAYDPATLAADANALHDAFGGDGDAVLIGHDWGAMAAYGAAAAAPGRWRRVVALAVPPMEVAAAGFFDYERLKRSFYIFVLQSSLAEIALTEDFVAGLWRDWSPGYGAGTDVAHAMNCLATPRHVAAAAGYYRAMFDGAAGAAPAADGPPVLYLHGAADGCLTPEHTFPGGDPQVVLKLLPSGSQVRVVADAGHFLHLERPDEVGGAVLDWITGSV